MSDVPVLFAELPAANGKRLGEITLNVEKTLNSLSLEMVDLMLDQLKQWIKDEGVVAVLIKGEGQKAFCAGGDIQALYQSAINKTGGVCEYAETFFENEYRLDYLLHTYPKPVLCWGHGIVMGGGLGIMAGCSHRVVTEKTRIAMPEVTIGLYPDIGGSWFLNRMPGKSGVFLALTGASINAADSLYIGMADHFITNDQQEAVVTTLLQQDWSEEPENNRQILTESLRSFEQASSDQLPAGNVAEHQEIIGKLCAVDKVSKVYTAIAGLETDDRWLVKARDSLIAGSPLSVLIIFRQLQVAKELSLDEVFRSELQLSTNIVRYPEFAEGVRALIIEKDRNPQWQFASLSDVPGDLLKQFFVSPWPQNPLANL